VVLGASGFVASGAVTLGSEGSLGDNWVQVAGTDQTVTLNSVEQVSAGDGSSGENTGSEGATGDTTDGEESTGDETGGDDGTDTDQGDSTTVSTSVEVLVDPSAANGLNSGGPAKWSGSIFETNYTTGTSSGYLRGIRDDEVNQNATTRIGTLSDSPPGNEVAFLVANVGPENAETTVPPVTVTMQLFDGENTITTNQIQFPYRVLDTDKNTIASGDDLATASGIELGTGEIIEVVIVLDTTGGTSDLQRLSDIQFSATG
jgi:hypothetical protein